MAAAVPAAEAAAHENVGQRAPERVALGVVAPAAVSARPLWQGPAAAATVVTDMGPKNDN